MTAPRPFRFGVQASTADDAEGLGGARPPGRIARLQHVDDARPLRRPAGAGAGADGCRRGTTTLRVGALVWDNDYKHPVVLAKELATMDVLSGGRLEIGLGAGWLATDYEQSGIPYDSNKVRVDRFEEGLAVIKGAMSRRAVLVRRRSTTRITDYTGSPTTGASAVPADPRRRRWQAGVVDRRHARPTSSASTAPCTRARSGRRPSHR